MLPLPLSPSLSTFAATRSLSFGQLAALSLSASRKYVKQLRSCGCACVADFSRERECCTCVLCVCERVLVCLPACECVRERVCSCARLPVRVCLCVWCAVAGLLEERSTFVFDFSFRSARFDVQECSSRGKARQGKSRATGCPAHVCHRCTIHTLQNRVNIAVKTTHFCCSALIFQCS